LLLLVSRLPAVGDLGQELTDAFNLFVAPLMHGGPARLDDLGHGYLPGFHVPDQRSAGYSQTLGSFVCRISIHSVVIMTDRY